MIRVIEHFFAFALDLHWDCRGASAGSTPQFGSYGGGPDIIDLANLNAHITVPMRTRAGRGTDFSYSVGYDTAVWYPVPSGSAKTWQFVRGLVAAIQSGSLGGYMTYSVQVNQTFVSCLMARGRSFHFFNNSHL